MSQSNSESLSDRLSLVLAKIPVFVLLILFLGLSVYCMSKRLLYPFEIDPVESDMVAHGMLLSEKQTVYAAPSTAFIAQLYPPVYYLVTAAFFRLFDTFNYLIPRMISITCLAGILVLLYRIAVKEGGSKSIGLIISGFFLSFYEIHGPCWDLARVDMLLYFLLLSGCYVLSYAQRNTVATLSAAIILVLACYTKQSGLYYLPFIALYLFFVDKKQCFVFSSVVFVLVVSLFFLLQYTSGGWFGTYVLFNPLRYNQVVTKPLSELPFRLLFELRDKLFPEIRYEIFYKLPVFFTIILAYVIQKALAWTRKTKLTIWEYTVGAAVIAYFSIRPHPGSERNDFIYMTLWGCILLGLLLIKLSESSFNAVRNSTRITVYLLLTVQLCLQLYSPKALVPTPEDIKKGYEFISLVKNMPGEVYLPYHSLYGVMADKKMIFNGGVYWAYQILAKERFNPADLIEKIKRKYFAAIILDDKSYLILKGERHIIDNVKMLSSSGDELSKVVEENYALVGRVPYRTDEEFRNITGIQTRPELILGPKKTP